MKPTLKNMVEELISLMNEYQKKYNIKEHCITNTQYLYDCIKLNFPKARTQAVLCTVLNDKKEVTKIITHMVVMIDDLIYDPSYEINSLQNVHYFDNVKSLVSAVPNLPKEKISNMITHFLEFIKFSCEINNGGLLISNNKIYHDQADYIEREVHHRALQYFIPVSKVG
jgi:hypothetical protein